MKKRLFNKLMSPTYGSPTPKMDQWLLQNNLKRYGNEIKNPIIFSLDEQMKFNKKHCKRTVKQIKILCNHFKHHSDENFVYIDIGQMWEGLAGFTIQYSKLFFKAVETNNYAFKLETLEGLL